MFSIGERVKYFNNDAIVLACLRDEVLIFISENYIKWVDRDFLELCAVTCKS